MLTVGSLFAGIGGFDLGFERAGMRTIWQVEQNEYCRKVLARHFPDAERFEDVCEVGAADLPRVDLICGGFPCQDLSGAGRGAGLDGARSGLWFEFARIVRELRPRYVVVENVPDLLAGRGKRWPVAPVGRVLGDLSEAGYDAEWAVLSAKEFGAPHLRERVWIVAYPSRDAEAGPEASAGTERERAGESGPGGGEGDVPDARREGSGSDARGAYGDEGEDVGRSEEDDHVAGSSREGGIRAAHGGERESALPDADGPRRESRSGESPRPEDEGKRRSPDAHNEGTDGVAANSDRGGLRSDLGDLPEGEPDSDRSGEGMADSDGEAGGIERSAGEALSRSGSLERSGRRGGGERVGGSAQSDVGGVADELPAGLDGAGGVDAEQGSDKKASAEDSAGDERVREMRNDGQASISASSGLRGAGEDRSSMLDLPSAGRRGTRNAPDEKAQDLHDLRKELHQLQSLSGKELLEAMSQRGWPPERLKALGWWEIEPPIPRTARGVPNNVDRLSALGNALIPEIAEWIGRRILMWESER